MGPRNSKESSVSFMTDYKVIEQNVSDNITFLQHKQSDEEYLLKQFTYNDKKQCEKMMQRLADLKIKLAGNKHVVPLKDYLMNSEDQYCSTFYKIYALFQYPQRTLDEEISQRKLHKKKFAQTQLWSILASCIVGLSHLQKNGIKHAALRSNNILLSREGVIKIADPFGIGQTPNYDTVYTKRSNIASSHIYLSPEQTQALQQEQITPILNPFKSDIWTLGMIVLEAGLLQYQDDECYRDQKSRIHWQTVQYNIDRLGQAYSDQMKHMIQFMLSRDERARPDWVELQEHVMKNGDEGRRSFIQQQSKVIQNNLHIDNQHQNLNQNKTVIVNQGTKTIPPTVVQQNTLIYTNQQKAGNFSELSQTSQNQRISGGILNLSNNPPFISSYQTSNNMNTTFGKLTRPDSPKVPPSSTAIYSNHSGTQTPNQIKSTNIHNNLINTPNLQPYSHNIVQNAPIVYTQAPIVPQLGAVNYGYSTLTPLRPSNIQHTRPMKNIFPADQYSTKTNYDENLILMVDDEASQTSERNYTNQGSNNQKFYSYGQNRQIQTNNISPVQRYNNYNNLNVGGGIIDNRYKKNSEPIGQYNQYQNKQQQQQNYSPSGNNVSNGNTELKYVTQQFKMGSRYQGYKLNGMRHGYGKFYYQDGGMYDGDWKENKMEGFGKLFYQSGKLAYEGQWRSDQFMGKGILYNQLPEQLLYGFNYNNFDEVEQFWTKYEGQFLDDMKNGRGILYLSNGERFQGNFVSDCVQGPGIFFCKNGERVLGNWTGNIKIN